MLTKQKHSKILQDFWVEKDRTLDLITSIKATKFKIINQVTTPQLSNQVTLQTFK